MTFRSLTSAEMWDRTTSLFGAAQQDEWEPSDALLVWWVTHRLFFPVEEVKATVGMRAQRDRDVQT